MVHTTRWCLRQLPLSTGEGGYGGVGAWHRIVGGRLVALIPLSAVGGLLLMPAGLWEIPCAYASGSRGSRAGKNEPSVQL